MAKAPVRERVEFQGFEDVEAGIVHWPMSVIRLRGKDRERLAALAEKILGAWREYSDESVEILAYTGDTPTTPSLPLPAAGERTMSWIWCCATTVPPKSILWGCSIPMPSTTM